MYDLKSISNRSLTEKIRFFVHLFTLVMTVCVIPQAVPVRAAAGLSGTEAVGASARWVQNDKGYRYRLADRSYVKNAFYKIGKHTYYFDAKGYRVTGWQKIGKKLYYFTTTGKMRTGWNKVKGKIFCFTSKGALRTGWYKPADGKVFYLHKVRLAYGGNCTQDGTSSPM